jgi:hypothetical protein
MIVTEYRIPFPATVEEYRVGMLYMIARASAEEARRAGNKVGVEVLRNEPYGLNEHGLPPGIYTEKVFHIRNLLPRFLRAFVPPSSAQVVEKVSSCGHSAPEKQYLLWTSLEGMLNQEHWLTGRI